MEMQKKNKKIANNKRLKVAEIFFNRVEEKSTEIESGHVLLEGEYRVAFCRSITIGRSAVALFRFRKI